jgi:F-type H+-transporting ATPase subunit gamma
MLSNFDDQIVLYIAYTGIVYNKARQAAVTNELMDIVGGAEALK